MTSRRLGFLAAGLTGVALLAAGLWLVNAPPQGAPGELAAAPAKPAPDPFGYSAAFDAEVTKLGQITPGQFAAAYPTPTYLAKPSWDYMTAKFFDQINADKVHKPAVTHPREGGGTYETAAYELPGYKLTPDELAAFKANGFVVSERLGGYSFGQAYYDVYTRDLPVFISSDSVLHAWHRSYDAMLAELERAYLKQALESLLGGLHDALPAAHAAYGAGLLADSVLDADYFLAVGRSLFTDGQVPSKFAQNDRVAATLAAVKNEGMHTFKLFGRNRETDFSQFKPRGHYEADPELHKYFKAMMWCGRTDLRVAGGYDASGVLSNGRELGAAVVLLDLLRRSGREESWRQFDKAIQTFVGRTDSATFDDLARVTAAAKVHSPADLKTDDDLKALADVILDSSAGKQDVRGDVYASPHPSVKVSLPRSFTVLGQKFVVDSWATSKVVFDDILWDNDKVVRRVPSCLDVAFAALGNNHVVPDLVGRIEGGSHPFRDGKPYQHNLAAVRNVLDGLEPKAWDETIYMAWLKALRTLSAPADAKVPEAMRTRAWAMKQTNTQLASWSQLRHDTIFYVKQSYTEGAVCYYPAGLVEPVVTFWAQLEATAGRSADLLAATPFPPAVAATQAKQVKFLRDFAAQMGRLKTVATKQLAHQELTAVEKKILEDVMQITHHSLGCTSEERYSGWYPALFYRDPKDCVKWDALVADVHTDVPSLDDPGCVLHQGIGGVDLLIVAAENGSDRVAYAGPTLSHYEFEMPGVSRKSDKEWRTDLLDAKVPPRPEWTRGYLVPHPDRKPVAEGWPRNQLLAEP